MTGDFMWRTVWDVIVESLEFRYDGWEPTLMVTKILIYVLGLANAGLFWFS